MNDQFNKLEQWVEETFQKVLHATDPRNRTLNRSIVDIDLQIPGAPLKRPDVTKLEVLAAWRDLIKTLRKNEVFLDYVELLHNAFQYLEATHPSTYKHCRTLLHLLKHTAEHSDQDDSTECRFVTLTEIMASYGPNWQPSSTVERFWVRLMQRISAEVPPINFRRKGYRVLVSLSWVPSSKGLLAACSFEEKRTFDPAKAAPSARAHFQKIRRTILPLPRHDSVNQILDRLKDETDVCVGITSELDGVGKTSLAALVASHPSIMQVFKVAWLSMTNEWHTEMDYETYTKYLTQFCEQLNITMEWPVCEKRFEEPALRRIREANFMQAARTRMAEHLRALGYNVLLVLDDVTQPQQIELFRFNERQSVIVTATDPTLRGLDWNVRLDVLSSDESLEVFVTELGLPADHVAVASREVGELIHYCDYHPLTVRTLGRWCRMRCVTAGLPMAIKELATEMGPLAKHAWERVEARAEKARQKAILSENTKDETQDSSESSDEDEDEDDPSTLLFDILSLMMGPDRRDGNGTSVIFVLCFAAMVVVFPEKVPLDVVLLLWEQLLRDEQLAQQELSVSGKKELKRRAWYVAEGLFHMGVVSIVDDEKGQAWIESYHEAYSDFAMIMAKELDLGDTFEETCEGWHKSFVTIYFNQRINADNSQSDEDSNSWEYAVEKLPDHIFRANMLSMAETMLADEHFFQARLDSMGWRRAIQVHIRDCVQLQQRLEESLENSMDTLTLSAVFTRTAAMVSSFAEGQSARADSMTVVQVSRALYDIGLALAEHGYFEDAMVQFEAAQSFMPESQALRASILYATSWVHLASGDIPEGLQKIRACRSVMEALMGQHPLDKEAMQLYADALIEKCDYIGALDTLNEVEEELLKDVESNWIELGSIFKKKGRLLHTIGKLEEAMFAYEKSVKWKQHIGENSQSLAATYSALGDLKMETKQTADARQHYEDALQSLQDLNCSPNHINFTLTSGKLRYLMGDFQASLSFLSRARHSINVAPLLVMDQSAYDLRCIAELYRARGEIQKALDTLGESLVLTSHRPSSLERAISLMHLGVCQGELCKHEESIKCLQQSLEIQMTRLPGSFQVVETTTRLGRAHYLDGDFDRALEKYASANAIIVRVAPNDAVGLADILYDKGRVYEAKNDRVGARQHYGESASVLKNANMRDHLGIAKAMHAIGRVTSLGSNIQEAVSFFQEAARIRRVHFDNLGLAETQHCLGVLASYIGDHGKAEKCFREALTLRQRHGKNKGISAATLLALGNNSFAQGNHDIAFKLYEDGLELLDDSAFLRGSFYMALGNLKASIMQYEESLAFFSQAKDIRVLAKVENDTRVARACLCLGVVHFLENHPEEVPDLLNAFVEICSGVDKAHIMQVTDVKHVTEHLILASIILGDVLSKSANPSDARKMWGRASEFCTMNEDLDSTLIDMVMKRLRLAPDEQAGLLTEEETCIRKCVFTAFEPNY